MRRTPVLWTTSVLTLLLGTYMVRSYRAKQPGQGAMQAVSIAQMAQTKVESQEPEISAATPADTGAVSVVGPLAVWMRDADGAQPEQSTVASGPLPSIDHVSAAQPAAEKYLRAEFPLKKSADFTFVIPPHTLSPRLQGSFSSTIRHSRADASRDAAKVDLVLMNAQQFDDFVHGRPAEATFELESSNRTVDFMLPAAYDQPKEYHLVFRDPAARARLSVKADFIVNAE